MRKSFDGLIGSVQNLREKRLPAQTARAAEHRACGRAVELPNVTKAPVADRDRLLPAYPPIHEGQERYCCCPRECVRINEPGLADKWMTGALDLCLF